MTLAKAQKQLSQAEVDALLGAAESEFKRAYLELITHLSDDISTDDILTMIRTGNVSQAILTTEKLAMGLSGVWAELYQDGAKLSSQFIQQAMGTQVRFDVVNSRAVAAIKQAQLRLIREVSESQRGLFRQILTRGLTAGTNPREVARELRASLGLTAYQEGVVDRYRQLLENGSAQALDRELRDARFDPRVQRAVDSGRPLPQADIDRMVQRYRERWVNYRAETIARTEGLRAASEGLQEGFTQAVANGDLAHTDIIRTWVTRHDGRSRQSHLDMHGQKRGLTEPFRSGLGNFLMQPRDPSAPAEDSINCRCRLTYRMA
jgi:Phage Mu protein F like protein